MKKVGSDFSGVGAFDQALIKLKIDYKTVYACDMDKYARQTYIENYGEPDYYPENVYDREIPKESLDIYMTSPPCQSFSLAGKRKGEDSVNGILFYNSHEFIINNNPRYFIFENVKGLLSDANGRTFQTWLDMLGGKSVNGNPVLFPREYATPYHIYHKVLNAKHFGVPQNRERVFIIGIRDDSDNQFSFPKPFHLTKRLKDVLENEVLEKFYLSEKAMNKIIKHKNPIIKNETPEKSGCIHAGYYKMGGRDQQYIKVTSNLEKYYLSEKMINGFLAHNKRHIEEKNQTGFNWKPKNENDIANCLRANGALCPTDNSIKVNSATNKGETMIGAFRGRNPKNPSDKTTSALMEQKLEINKSGTSNTITSVQKDNVVILHNLYGGFGECEPRVFTEHSPAIRTASGGGHIPSTITNHKIRRLTPRECFRLMDFPDSFTWPVSDTQAYKQAGNSIVVNVLAEIIKKLNL